MKGLPPCYRKRRGYSKKWGKMSAREIVKMIVEALESGRDSYLEWLQNEDYDQIEDELTEYLSTD